MKSKCLFFGNCQMYIIKEFLIDTDFNNLYECDLFSSHINTCDDLEKIYEKLNIYSLIFIQPHYNYRDNEKYNISSIVKYVDLKCKIIVIPSSYFKFYYPFLTYAFTDDKLLREPSDYHDKNFIDLYNKEKDIVKIKNEYNKLLNDDKLLSLKDLKKIARDSMKEIIKRENAYKNENYGVKLEYNFITISHYIKENYKKKLLFYSMNHPTYYLFEYIVNEILKILNLKECIDSFSFKDHLSNTHPPIYKCLAKAVEFDINNYFTNINNVVDNDKIMDMYLKDYSKYENIHYNVK